MATNGKRSVVVTKNGNGGRTKPLLCPLPFLIKELDVPDHLYYALRKVEVNEVFVLTTLSGNDLSKMGLSSRLIQEAEKALKKLGLHLNMRDDEIVEVYNERVYS